MDLGRAEGGIEKVKTILLINKFGQTFARLNATPQAIEARLRLQHVHILEKRRSSTVIEYTLALCDPQEVCL